MRGVYALAAAETLVWAGTFYLFPALLPHWENDLGWAKTELAMAFSGALAVSALGAPLAGRLIDRGHGRALLTGSTAAAALLVLLLSRAEALWQFCLLWLALGAAMAGALYEPCFAFLTRTLGAAARPAITRVTLIAGFAGTVAFPGCHLLAVGLGFGWRGAALAFALLIGLIAAPLMWFGTASGRAVAVAPGESAVQSGAARRALRSATFWLLAVAFALLMLNHGMLISHLLPLLAERGVAQTQAVLAAAGIGPMQVVGRLVMLALERHVGVVTVSTASFVLVFAAGLALFGAGSAGFLIAVFVLLQGAGYGVTSITRPLVTAEYLGRAEFGALSGLLAIPFLTAAACAPTVAALVWRLGGYDLMLTVCVLLALIGLGCFLAVRRLSG